MRLRQLMRFGAVVALSVAMLGTSNLAWASERSGTSGGGAKKFAAKLVVLPDDVGHVEVQRAGKSSFKQADDGAKLHEGDTVRTDDVGHAEVDYTDDSYTRLDVNTTFTVVTLVDDQGVRQVSGSLETGRTWNRTEALTESESFDQEAGGATAAVVGTAFSLQCTLQDQVKFCGALAVLHNVLLTGSDEDNQKLLSELDLCEISEGKLCDTVDPQSLQDMIDNAWTQLNLQRDLLERGLGPGPFTEVAGAAVTQVPGGVGGDVVVSPDDYTPGVAGASVTVTQGAFDPGGKLPFTGSNDSPSWALLGLALAAIGTVLVLAARRRAQVLQRH